ncbi:hypothetical protein ABZY42_17405 [Streptomyces sp. NPDC006622]
MRNTESPARGRPGRLQYDRALDWTHGNKLKRTIEITPTGDLKAD